MSALVKSVSIGEVIKDFFDAADSDEELVNFAKKMREYADLADKKAKELGIK